jgi:prepilin-type N-terminal cleavage/methylation domain-containing protein
MTTRFHPARKGFTLIEMVIALAVFVMLAGAVFGIFSATLQSVAALQDNQNRNDRTEALGAWLKRQMLDLPASGTIVSYHRDGAPFHVSGIIWGAGADLQALDLHLQANGEYTLRLAAYPPSSGSGIAGLTGTISPQFAQFTGLVIRDDDTLAWRTLVRDLNTADWRFLAPNQTQWQDATTGPKPAIAELIFQPAGASAAVTDDFWIPPTQAAINPVLTPAPGAVSANP